MIILPREKSYKSFLAIAGKGRYNWLFYIVLYLATLPFIYLHATLNTGVQRAYKQKSKF